MTRGGDGGAVFVFCLGRGGDDGGLTGCSALIGERTAGGKGWFTALVRGCLLRACIILMIYYVVEGLTPV